MTKRRWQRYHAAPRYSIRLDEHVHLVPTRTITERFGVPKTSVTRWLVDLGIPTIAVGDQEYFNMYALKRAIYLVTQVGAPGFLCIGSKLRRSKKDRPAARHLTAITPEILAELQELDPDWEIRHVIRDSLNTKALGRLLDKIGHTRGGKEPTNRTIRKIKAIAKQGQPFEVDGTGDNQ